MSSNNEQQPGLVGSHAQYVKGAANAIGSVTGSEAWAQSGEQQKAEAVSAMKSANESRDPAKSGFGSVEQTAGTLTGCEGMKEEGAASKQQ
ncbi:hypothetical protein NA57DRAFT_45886 [Rhizodiscina lignyota]|uniref:Uncharacterized protein n=1 Tax=Rhizodiscina lignyota TaxID=1504668 RepID=A0A9P4IAD8_9PEZI|nr:hypothetical protein NA57DRAFT_45886 [Rhizodiscina lignyota]